MVQPLTNLPTKPERGGLDPSPDLTTGSFVSVTLTLFQAHSAEDLHCQKHVSVVIQKWRKYKGEMGYDKHCKDKQASEERNRKRTDRKGEQVAGVTAGTGTKDRILMD